MEYLLEPCLCGCPEVPYEVKPIRDLNRLRYGLGDGAAVLAGAVTRDDLNAWVRFEPRAEDGRRTLRQQIRSHGAARDLRGSCRNVLLLKNTQLSTPVTLGVGHGGIGC